MAKVINDEGLNEQRWGDSGKEFLGDRITGIG